MKKLKKIEFVGISAALVKLGPKLVKPLLTGGKLLKGALFGGSAVGYTALFGWKVAVMILILLFFHEGGHIWAMKRRGMKTKGMYFIPFFGAAAVPDENFPSRESENFIALMGPTVGLILAFLSYLAYLLTGDIEFAAASGWMALVNLFNLLPIMPLDGGRVLRSISFSFSSWFGIISVSIGILIGIIIFAKMKIWLFVVLMPIGFLEVLFDYKRERKNIKYLRPAEIAKEIFERISDKSKKFAEELKQFGENEKKEVEKEVEKFTGFLENERKILIDATKEFHSYSCIFVLKLIDIQLHQLKDPERVKELIRYYENKEFMDNAKTLMGYEIKEYFVLPKMSALQMVRGIIWTIGVGVCLFLIIYWANIETNGSYFEYLK